MSWATSIIQVSKNTHKKLSNKQTWIFEILQVIQDYPFLTHAHTRAECNLILFNLLLRVDLNGFIKLSWYYGRSCRIIVNNYCYVLVNNFPTYH